MRLDEFLKARLDEQESGVREALKTEDWGVTQFDLDDIASKRAILEIHTPDPRDLTVCTTCGEPLEYTVSWPCDTVRHLAAPYAYHADYNREWLPTGLAV